MRNRLFEEIYNAGNGKACVALLGENGYPDLPQGLFFSDEALRNWVNHDVDYDPNDGLLYGNELTIESMKDPRVARDFTGGLEYYSSVADAFKTDLDLYFDDFFYEYDDEDNPIVSLEGNKNGLTIKFANKLSQEECNAIKGNAIDICVMFSHVRCNGNSVEIMFDPKSINPSWSYLYK